MKLRAPILAGLIALLCHVPASAHHPLTDYNRDQTRTIEGTLVELQLSNPHSLLLLDVHDQSGGSQRWTIEWFAAFLLKQQGVTRGTLTGGDHLIITGYAARNPADHRLWLRTIRRPADGWNWTGGFLF
jgi:hypothetical protein